MILSSKVTTLPGAVSDGDWSIAVLMLPLYNAESGDLNVMDARLVAETGDVISKEGWIIAVFILSLESGDLNVMDARLLVESGDVMPNEDTDDSRV